MFNYAFLCTCEWVCKQVQVLQRSQASESLGVGVTGDCELPDTGAGNQA